DGASVRGPGVIQLRTGSLAASKSVARARTISRSGKIPTSRSSSSTRTDPTCRVDITVAASATEVVGATVTIERLITRSSVVMSRIEPSPRRRDRGRLLAWYAPRAAAYPWRVAASDPYAVLVSEVMLQQTQAPRV